MAINFGLFQFASPPRTATTWIRHAAVAAGLTELNRNQVHVPHCKNKSVVKLTCVRHPCRWLGSYHSAIYPGKIGVIAVDSLSLGIPHPNFDQWVRCLLAEEAGSVGSMIDAYNADVVIRVEDLPWAFVEFLESFGVEKKDRERCLSIQQANSSAKLDRPRWNPSLWDRVIESESEMIGKYEY